MFYEKGVPTNKAEFTKEIEFPIPPHIGLLIKVLDKTRKVIDVELNLNREKEGELSVRIEPIDIDKDVEVEFAYDKLVERGWDTKNGIFGRPPKS